MRLSTSTCIHERVRWGKNLFYTLEDSLRMCVKSGYKVIDMNFASYSRGDLPMTQPNWEDWVRRHADIASSLGVEWSQGHAHFFNWSQITDRKWHDELVKRSIIGAGILGVKWLVIHPGTVYDGSWYSYKDSLAANIETCQMYGEWAAQNNVALAIENMIEGKPARTYASSTEELLELHDKLDDPLFGICWDTGHAHMNGVDQPAALRTIGSRLKALHIADNDRDRDAHVAPYFGTIEWEPIMQTLKEIDYQGDFTFEIHNFTNGLPHGLHDQAIRFTYELGNFMLDSIK